MAIATALKALDQATPSVKLDHVLHLPPLNKPPPNHPISPLRSSNKDCKGGKPLPRAVGSPWPGHSTNREAWVKVAILVYKGLDSLLLICSFDIAQTATMDHNWIEVGNYPSRGSNPLQLGRALRQGLPPCPILCLYHHISTWKLLDSYHPCALCPL